MMESTSPLESLSGAGGSVTELAGIQPREGCTLTERVPPGTCGLGCEENRLVGM